MNIPVEILKEAVYIVAPPWTEIWKCVIILGRRFSSQLKLAYKMSLRETLETTKWIIIDL